MQTIKQFILAHGMRMACTRTNGNPNMQDMPRGSSHYLCTLSTGDGAAMSVPFSMGPAHTKEPDLASVLDCLASDAAGFENARSFEDWAAEYGYDTDSRKAEATYNTVEKQAEILKTLLGDDAYNSLLWDTERE